MRTAEESVHVDEALAEVRRFLDQNWDPDLSVGEWWDRLGTAGWSVPSLPVGAFGRGLSRRDAARVVDEIVGYGALGPPGGLGTLLAAPMVASHGTREQIDRYLRAIVTGKEAWCQLFSEPGAGSDLAGLSTRAEESHGEFVVNGQKVWTTNAQIADLGMLVARTDRSVPKHKGLSFFAFPMRQPGVTIRPLREMTGEAAFNEVFLTDAVVDGDAVIGGLGQGWAVTTATLALERAGLGAGADRVVARALPGSIPGHLERRAGDFVHRRGARTAVTPPSPGTTSPAASGAAGLLIGLARDNGTSCDPVVRQGLAHLHALGEIGRLLEARAKAARSVGSDIPGVANMSKLLMSKIVARTRDLSSAIVGAQAMLHGNGQHARDEVVAATGNRFLPSVTDNMLRSPGVSIYGGTDEIQRNLLGEQALGLPREPRTDQTVPFSELARIASPA